MDRMAYWQKPCSLPEISWWHFPLPEERGRIASHPTMEKGFGLDIERVRELAPGEDRTFFSPAHTAQFGKPMGVFFLRTVPAHVAFLGDLPPSMNDFGGEKRGWMAKLAATIGQSVLNLSSDGEFTVIGVGAQTIHSDALADPIFLPGAIKTFFSQRVRRERGESLSQELMRYATETRERLIIVCSDFLIPPKSPEWKRLSAVRRAASDNRHEIIFFRILHEQECAYRGGGLAVHDTRGRQVWAGPGTSRALERRHAVMRRALRAIVQRPHIRFFDLRTDENFLPALKRFLRRRERFVCGTLAISA